ncbi:hypothetical protein SANA_03860 [Gottschalkiaceae bacterium SANA]|nr:hypothetical protein SANA_03860 [Gottschalkiaceae bacterium SANA]
MDNKNRFLLIDDLENNLISLKALILEAFPDAEVAMARDGLKGVQLATTFKPDVIILDIFMPQMDGFQVCRRVKADAKLEGIPVLFVTAEKNDRENRIKAIQCGGEGFLSKPIDEVELYVQLRTMLKVGEKNRVRKDRIQVLNNLATDRTAELEVLKQKYKGLLDDLPAMISEHLPDSTLTYVNQRYCDFHKMSAEELIGRKFIDFMVGPVKENYLRRFQMMTPNQPTNVLIRKTEKQGKTLWMEWRNRGIFNETGELIQLVSIGLDITERKEAESTLIHLSYHDHLTGLYNRRFFDEEMKRMDQARNLPLTIVNADVNGLKIVNDSFGHQQGDHLLKSVADAMKEGFRADDIVARIGGDEFAVILTKTDASIAKQIISRVKDKVRELSDGNSLQSVSFGYDVKTSSDQDIDAVFTKAENDMYRHKVYESASMRSKVVGIIMNSLFEKSEREMSHSIRVGTIAASIAQTMNFSEDHIMEIRIAGYIHDIGKIGVQEKILNKVGKLTKEEWIEIKNHPEAGSRILSSVSDFKVIAGFILAHHERWDGKGYPNHLLGEAIPVEARIISVADAYDAMTAERSYRMPMSKEEATAELVKYSGSQFNPAVVEAFLNTEIPENIDYLQMNVFRELMGSD